MRQKRVLSFFLAVLMMVTTVLPIGEIGQAEAKAKKKITLNKKKITLRVGKKFRLKVRGTSKKVVWKSSKKKVATVNKKGWVRAKKKGTAKITARVSGKKLKCRVTVKKKTAPKPTKKPEITPTPSGTSGTADPGATGTPLVTPGNTDDPQKTPGNTETPGGPNDPNNPDDPSTPEEGEKPLAPVISKESGIYAAAFDLTIDSEPGTTIYYTTDGSIPTKNSEKYTGSISVKDRNGMPNVLCSRENIKKMYIQGSGYDYTPTAEEVAKCTVLRAVAVSPGGKASDVVTKSYFVGNDVKTKYAGANVMSVVIDPKDLLDEETGIHVLGKIYDEWKKGDGKGIASSFQYWNYEGNYTQHGRDWERPVEIAYFDSGKESLEFEEAAGIRLHGGASRMYGQKSFNFYFREDYGNKNLKYALIPGDLDAGGKQIKKYKSFMLRNGGNDTEYSKIRDLFNQNQLSDCAFSVQAATPCVLFLNGEYWGLYNLTEKYSDNSIENNYDVSNKNVIIFKEGELEEGEDEDQVYYDELWSYADKDFKDDSVYQKFCEIMDIDSFADYYAAEIYIANQDWKPDKNYQLWRSREAEEDNPYGDTKWRYLIYDTEYSMGLYNSMETSVNYDSFARARNNDPLFAAVIKSESFQQKFIAALKRIGSVNFDPNICDAKLAEYTAIYKPLMQDFYTRFYGADTWQREQFDPQVSTIKNFVSGRYAYIVPKVESWCNAN